MQDKLIIFDTTLRDGEQSPGATMTVDEKKKMALQLEKLGVDVIEAGFPASSDGDFEAVKTIAKNLHTAQISALCRANTADIDRAWDALKYAKKPRIHIVIATSPIHMEYKLRKTPAEVIDMAVSAVRHAAKYTSNVEFSAEDASRSEKPFLAQIFTAAIDAGATTVNIPDTVGYAHPEEFGGLINYIAENVPNIDKAVISVHCHNDLGLAVSNSLAAIKNGARQVETCLCGIGERAGNAALEEIVMGLHVRSEYYQVACGIHTEQLYPSCQLLNFIIGRQIPANKPVVGSNAFAHESGIHQDGVLKKRETYEIMSPETVGRKSSEIIIGKHSGRNALRSKLEGMGYKLDGAQVEQVFSEIKQLADKKSTIHDEDIEHIVLSGIYGINEDQRFQLVDINVSTNMCSRIPASVSVLIRDNDAERRHSGFGVGPIDATFRVLSEACKMNLELKSFAINAITGGTDATGEVVVNLGTDECSAIGRGAHSDIIVASAKAYIDALNKFCRKNEGAAQVNAK